METEELKLGWTEHQHAIIKVMGVGGGGGNAVTYMYEQGIHHVDFVICNTDEQALNKSSVPAKIRLGKERTKGLGAGSKPEVGREAAMESEDEIRKALDDGTRMVFVTAGMGGGTGTGAAPVIARVAKEMGLLTVAIVTIPFGFEGPLRQKQAKEGITELRQHVDSLLIIKNERLREIYGNLRASQAFSKADDVLTTAAKGIAELITCPGTVNVDFADVSTIMSGGGITIMGSARASGENRARTAVETALNSPLLNSNKITGAGRILLNITSGTGDDEVTMDEITEITDFVTCSAKNPEMIWGTGVDENLGDALSVTIVATHFSENCFPELDITPPPPLPPPVHHPPSPSGGAPQDATDGKRPYIKDRSTGNTFVQPGVKRDESAAATGTMEIPPLSILDENVSIDELENTPAYVRRKVKMDNRAP
ncbi:MAG: cell division protein FtsZ, partial [Bacteroidales bacterium]|nr:cell division protein FtsZ [Bacteroidales bacterium]